MPMALAADDQHPVILVNREATTSRAIDRTLVRSIYAGHVTHWANGTLVRPIILPTRHALYFSFCTTILGIYPYQLERRWDQLRYSGNITTDLITAQSEDEVIDTVKKDKGAVGYISAATAAHINDAELMIIEVQP